MLCSPSFGAATRSGANQGFFVQKRFELRSVIATIETLSKIAKALGVGVDDLIK
ncbi:MAG: hypothetical protein V1891_01180 [bacterium]